MQNPNDKHFRLVNSIKKDNIDAFSDNFEIILTSDVITNDYNFREILMICIEKPATNCFRYLKNQAILNGTLQEFTDLSKFFIDRQRKRLSLLNQEYINLFSQ